MNTRRRCLVAAALAAATLVPARAEVSAVIDGFGTYVETVVVPSPGQKVPKLWFYQGWKLGHFPLNVAGDLTGDRYPLIAESPANRHPYVVWGRPTAGDVDLMWSRWTGTSWTPVAPVTIPSKSGSDLAPRIAFDTDARPHLVWWRNEGGKGRVYLSIFLETIWMMEIGISDIGVDSRNPSVTVNPDRTIVIEFDTPYGHESRLVTFQWPVSINDDITPMGRVEITTCAVLGRKPR
jgi:hypothetical protein